jgi:uncharacterized protein YeaO (DUF488 family)
MVKVKRVYDPPSGRDGRRVLVDRLWPRGIRKDEALVDAWMKELAPGTELRTWFGHDPQKWGEFKRRFFLELQENEDAVKDIVYASSRGTVTLLFGSREERYNNAVALKEYIEARQHASGRKRAA